MKNLLRLSVGLGAAVLTLGQLISSGAAENPAGHWEGSITLPNTSLGIRVDLERREGKWLGTIDIPVQGLRGFSLSDISLDDAEISFAMPNIPGEPRFSGALAQDGKTIAGVFKQSGQNFDFRLERRGDQAPKREGETPSKGVPGDGIAGVWQGSLRVSVMELRLVVKLSKSESGELAGTMDSLDQNANDIPISKVSEEGRTLQFEISRINGEYRGELSRDGSEIVGEWKQGGQAMPLVLKRLERAPELIRPQEPKKPYPYIEEEVIFQNENAGITLAGTLTVPRSDGPHPGVVLISGSGPQDRNEAIMGHRPFLVLADHLTRRGIAVLRFDDRGVGKSEGDFGKATNLDFTSDVLAAASYLLRRKEIDSKHIGLIGHSEGGITAPRAAVRSDDVAFVVLLAGVGVPIETLLLQQGKDILRVMGADAEALERQVSVQRRIFRIARDKGGSPDAKDEVRAVLGEVLAKYTPEQKEALGISGAALEGQIGMVLSPWFQELLTFDPSPVLKQIKCPVLAINGEKDLQVASKANLDAIKAALRDGGNSDVTTVEFPGLNHLFQECETGAVAEYGQIEETFNPAALKLVSDWILERVK